MYGVYERVFDVSIEYPFSANNNQNGGQALLLKCVTFRTVGVRPPYVLPRWLFPLIHKSRMAMYVQ
jgi:hypothetical protein